MPIFKPLHVNLETSSSNPVRSARQLPNFAPTLGGTLKTPLIRAIFAKIWGAHPARETTFRGNQAPKCPQSLGLIVATPLSFEWA
jgi:hypothetical protein